MPNDGTEKPPCLPTFLPTALKMPKNDPFSFSQVWPAPIDTPCPFFATQIPSSSVPQATNDPNMTSRPMTMGPQTIPTLLLKMRERALHRSPMDWVTAIAMYATGTTPLRHRFELENSIGTSFHC